MTGVCWGRETGPGNPRISVEPPSLPTHTRAGVTHRVPIKGVSSFAPRPSGGGGALLAAYCPEAKGSPASVGLYSAEPGADGTPICRKNFFRVRHRRARGKGAGKGWRSGDLWERPPHWQAMPIACVQEQEG